MTKEVLLGAHMSIGGGAHMAIERACTINCTAMQIFVKNNMQWFARPLTREEISLFLQHRERGQLLSIFAHANYLINLAATNPQFHTNTLRALSEELIRADQFDLPFLVIHPGAHLGAGEEAGLNTIIRSINQVLRKLPKIKTRIALETTAGQGSCLGHTFEQISYIIESVHQPERLCVCLDTAHVFAAGYDIRNEVGVRKMFREFDRIIGLHRLAAIHLNDSKAERGPDVIKPTIASSRTSPLWLKYDEISAPTAKTRSNLSPEAHLLRQLLHFSPTRYSSKHAGPHGIRKLRRERASKFRHRRRSLCNFARPSADAWFHPRKMGWHSKTIPRKSSWTHQFARSSMAARFLRSCPAKRRKLFAKM